MNYKPKPILPVNLSKEDLEELARQLQQGKLKTDQQKKEQELLETKLRAFKANLEEFFDIYKLDKKEFDKKYISKKHNK